MPILQSKLTTYDGVDVSASNPLPVSATFTTGDIEIGAVELKDATTTARAVIDATYGLAIERKARPLTTTLHTAPTAGVASGTALAANASRRYALIVNDSANVVYINLSATAVLNTGIRLNANGGSYEITETNLYTGIITSITTVALQTLLVTEGV